jgi:hypothetical protein
LTKERELRLRILTLLTNRKRLLLHLGRSSVAGPNDIDDIGQGMSSGDAVKKSVEWANLEEGWRLFERDLGKLQVRLCLAAKLKANTYSLSTLAIHRDQRHRIPKDSEKVGQAEQE